MKFRLIVLLSLFVLLPSFASSLQAQTYSKYDFFGGFALQSDEAIGQMFLAPGLSNLFGWQAGYAHNVNKTLGVAADVSGTYRSFGGTTTKNLLYMIGPRFNKRSEGATLFAHSMFGWLRTSDPSIPSSTGFAMAFGGGIDGQLNDRLSVRTQADWIPEHTFGAWAKNDFRIAAGIVVHAGK